MALTFNRAKRRARPYRLQEIDRAAYYARCKSVKKSGAFCRFSPAVGGLDTGSWALAHFGPAALAHLPFSHSRLSHELDAAITCPSLERVVGVLRAKPAKTLGRETISGDVIALRQRLSYRGRSAL